MNEREAYLVLHKASGIKPGDTVKVLRTAKSCEMGWNSGWDPRMNDLVGRELNILTDHRDCGFSVDGYRWVLPFFVLEKVADAPEVSEIDKLVESLRFDSRTTSGLKALTAAIIKECKK